MLLGQFFPNEDSHITGAPNTYFHRVGIFLCTINESGYIPVHFILHLLCAYFRCRIKNESDIIFGIVRFKVLGENKV